MRPLKLIAIWLLAGTWSTACSTAEEVPEPEGVAAPDDTAGFEAAYQERESGKQDTAGCSGVLVPDRGPFGKRIALTFDDGPNGNTQTVIDTLRKHDAPATFFMLGKQAKQSAYEGVLQTIIDDPLFEPANHSYSHQNIKTLSPPQVDRQIDDTQAVLLDRGAAHTFFRFPYGSSSCATAEAVRARDYTIAGWHVDSADWCFAKGDGHCSPRTFRYVDDRYRDDMIGYILSQLRRTQGGVMLFHDVHGYTANALDEVLTTLEDEGYTFVRLDDAATFPFLNGADPATAPFVGDACEADDDCAFGQGYCHPSGFCTTQCEGYCPDQLGKVGTFCVADTGVEPLAGICVSQSTEQNGHCADVPGTIDASAERFIGSSGAAAKSDEVCIPQ